MKILHARVLCWLFATALLAGCGGKDAASFIASAKSYMAKADYSAATIEIKNALQKDPDNREARTLLAKALLETGNPGAAETECARQSRCPRRRTRRIRCSPARSPGRASSRS